MNIKNRLKKLEQEIVGTESEEAFCECFDKDILASINKAYGKPYNESDILPEGMLISDVCQGCKKPVAKHIHKFYRDINESYGPESQKK